MSLTCITHGEEMNNIILKPKEMRLFWTHRVGTNMILKRILTIGCEINSTGVAQGLLTTLCTSRGVRFHSKSTISQGLCSMQMANDYLEPY